MTTLNKDTKFPAYVVWMLVVLAIGGALAWADIRNQISRLNREAITQEQFQSWRYNAYSENHKAFDSLVWPALPPKAQ